MPDSQTLAAPSVPVSGEPGIAPHHRAPYDFKEVMASHTMPYSAWEITHGRPVIIFDLAGFAAGNMEDLRQEKDFAKADASTHMAWAQDVAGRYGVAPNQLSKAMTVAEGEAWYTFPRQLHFLNQQMFFGTLTLVLLAVVLFLFRPRRGQVAPTNRLQLMIESVVEFVREDIVRPNLPHPERWTVHFSCMFLAILLCNLTGMIPGSSTSTGNIGITAGLAITTLISMLWFGMREQGVVGFWIHMVPVKWSPRPADAALWILLAGIELMGLLIKPAALAIRLFANMFADHAVLLVFLSLGFILHAALPNAHAFAIGMQGFGWFLATAFYLIELMVCFIQAYVFTLLSAVFIGLSMHPEH